MHESRIDEVERRLVASYKQVRIGNPLDPKTLMARSSRLRRASIGRGRQFAQERRLLYWMLARNTLPGPGYFVEPTIVRARNDMPVVKHETFAPILYVIPFRTLDDAIARHNDTDYGLSSAIFTDRLQHAERFLSASGSDCGIANVNIGTSGAEIGGAFGGEKDTVAAANRAPIPGRSTCAARRTRSTTRATCRSRRASSSTSIDAQRPGSLTASRAPPRRFRRFRACRHRPRRFPRGGESDALPRHARRRARRARARGRDRRRECRCHRRRPRARGRAAPAGIRPGGRARGRRFSVLECVVHEVAGKLEEVARIDRVGRTRDIERRLTRLSA